MSGDMISPVAVQRIDTVVMDPVTGEPRRRTDYAGTVWYGGRPQLMGSMVVSQGRTAHITTPFWLPDSHAYDPDTTGDVLVQVSAAVQSMSDDCQIFDAVGGLGVDPRGSGALLAYVGVNAAARVPLGVAYRVTVICRPEAVQTPAS